jgi:hypothetical protein
MKTKLLVWLLLIASLSCCTSTEKPVSDAEKKIIKKEVKKIVNIFITACEQAKFNMALSTFNDSPDFKYIYNGQVLSYDDFIANIKPLFQTITNQKFTIRDEEYSVLDNSTVLYTAKVKGVSNFKDGHSVLVDQGAMQLVFKRIDVRWQIIYAVESTVEKTVEGPRKLNQVELFKQFVGSWKGELGKDTTFTWIGKSVGSSIEGRLKIKSKRKTVMEARIVNAYDKHSDKFVETEIYKRSEPLIFVSWFTSKNRCEAVMFKDFPDPKNASLKTWFEFKSRNVFIQITTKNNIPIDTITYHRVKR